MADCDFCAELAGVNSNAFHRIYGSDADRVVALSRNLVALPTLGQLFPGSLLVLPREHVEMFSRTSAEIQDELKAFIEPLWRVASGFGHPIMFEHGAQSCTGASCGIYHAHIHIVPLPKALDFTDVLPQAQAEAGSLREALQRLTHASKYIMVGDERGVRFASDDLIDGLPSQFVRRRLVETFAVPGHWDWRTYGAEEPWLKDAIDRYRNA